MARFGTIALDKTWISAGYEAHIVDAKDETEAESLVANGDWIRKVRKCSRCSGLPEAETQACTHFSFFLDRTPYADGDAAKDAIDPLWPTGMERIHEHKLKDGTERFKQIFRSV